MIHDTVGFVARAGMFWQVELVRDKATREPFIPEVRYATFGGDLSEYPTRIILSNCLEKGVLLGGFLPNTLRIGPSLTVSKEDVDMAVDALDHALDYLDSTV